MPPRFAVQTLEIVDAMAREVHFGSLNVNMLLANETVEFGARGVVCFHVPNEMICHEESPVV